MNLFMIAIITSLAFVASGCTLFSKSEQGSDLQELGQEVLKAKEGLDIEINPIKPPASK